MPSPAHELERALAAFRREHAVGYLKVLAGHARDPRVDGRARAFVGSERGRALLEAAHGSGEVQGAHYAALCAHFGRATLERAYERARDADVALLAREVSVEGDTRSLGQLLTVWQGAQLPASRERVAASMNPALERFAAELVQRRAEADGEVATLFAALAPPRHPDAGPEAGGAELARTWLDATGELAREALAFTRRALGAAQSGGSSGLDHLWLVLGQALEGLCPREGRLRRLASEWEPLGLRRLLSSRARVAPAHPGPRLAPHLLVLAAPHDVRVSPAEREYGLSSELAMAEGVGRAVALVHASEALPLALRLPTVGTVARALGSLAVQRMMSEAFLRRVRGYSRRESELVARLSAGWFLLDSRLAAAAVLARSASRSPSRSGPAMLDQVAELAERALLGTVPAGAAALLVLRAAPGGALRGKVHGPALSWALRERYDEDWYLNPRAGEPLRGAAARAGELSVEALVDEQSTSLARGIEQLAELF